MQLTHVLLMQEEGPVDLRALVVQLAEWYPQLPVEMLAVPAELQESAGDADSLALIVLGGLPVAILGYDRPLSAEELAEPFRRSWWWSDAQLKTAQHRAHFILTVPMDRGPGPTAALEQMRPTAAAAAAIAATAPALATLVAPGRVLHPIATLLDAQPHLFDDEPPLPLWLCIWPQSAGEDDMGQPLARVATLGLQEMLGFEIDTDDLPADPAHLFNLTTGIAALLVAGNRIAATDTLDGGIAGPLHLADPAPVSGTDTKTRRLKLRPDA